jgi:hypothetical protein
MPKSLVNGEQLTSPDKSPDEGGNTPYTDDFFPDIEGYNRKQQEKAKRKRSYQRLANVMPDIIANRELMDEETESQRLKEYVETLRQKAIKCLPLRFASKRDYNEEKRQAVKTRSDGFGDGNNRAIAPQDAFIEKMGYPEEIYDQLPDDRPLTTIEGRSKGYYELFDKIFNIPNPSSRYKKDYNEIIRNLKIISSGVGIYRFPQDEILKINDEAAAELFSLIKERISELERLKNQF